MSPVSSASFFTRSLTSGERRRDKGFVFDVSLGIKDSFSHKNTHSNKKIH